MSSSVVFVRHTTRSLLLVVLFLLPPLLLVGLMVAHGVDLHEWGDTWLASIRDRPGELINVAVPLVVAFVGMPLFVYAERSATLVLNGHTLTMHSRLPAGLAKLTKRSWSIDLAQLQEAVLSPGMPHGNVMSLLLVAGDGSRYPLEPQRWRSVSGPRKEGPEIRLRSFRVEELQSALRTEPLLWALSKVGVPIKVQETFPRQTVQGTDLTRFPQAMAAMGLLALLGFYGLVDGFVIREYAYLGAHPWGIWLGAGLFTATLVSIPLLRSRLPGAEALMLAIMVGGAAGLAAYPGALRINALTDPHGPRSHEYVLGSGGTLQGEEALLPELTSPINLDYWTRQPVGSRHEILLFKGALGFWQYHHPPVLERVRVFNETRRSGNGSPVLEPSH